MHKENGSFGRLAAGCHMCKEPTLIPILDLGPQPHSDWFPTEEELGGPEIRYPLRLVACTTCGLLQIDYFVNPETLYQGDYLYQSSTTQTGVAHYRAMAEDICTTHAIPQESLVIDIGSNVGVLLQGFKDCGMRVLGVDPAHVATEIANKNGIETITDFFTLAVATDIGKRYGHAMVLTGTNVFAHLHELDDAVEGMKQLLAPEGVIAIEAPHALPLIQKTEYDTIYHQHIGYLSVRPMRLYMERMGLELFDVQELPIHGGTLRYYVGHPGKHSVSDMVRDIEAREEQEGVYSREALHAFAERVKTQRLALLDLLIRLQAEGKRVVAVSTPAKGNTLLNYCGLGTHLIAYATERNPLKVGRYTPGTQIPIRSDEAFLQDQPDYALILAWNFADEIMQRMASFKERGGKFIIPIPEPKII